MRIVNDATVAPKKRGTEIWRTRRLNDSDDHEAHFVKIDVDAMNDLLVL